MRFESLVIVLLCALGVHAAVYTGKVVDEKGQPISYATVYPEVAPELGTATNNDGIFRFEANLPASSPVVVSFIGFEKVEVTGDRLRVKGDAALQVIVLKEQPIALQETVVAAKSSKQRNKRKQMATLLHAVYVQLEKEFPDEPAQYQVVSDVRMTSGEAQTGHAAVWGMEQMIANIVVLPEAGKDGRDSVQFQGRYCKRFFDARKRAQADSILAGETLERLEKAQKDVPKGTSQNYMRRAANAVDSGVVVHEALFAIGNMRYDFQETMNDIKHWSVSNESEGETVLTHTQTVSKYLGCFKMTFQRHYIIDSRTYSVRRFSEHAEVKVVIPFGIKLNSDQLQMLNLVNMDEEQINKFRLKRLRGAVDLNTIYQRRNGLVYTQEKNMILNAFIVGSKKTEIPLNIQATQRVTDLQTEGVKALKKHQLTRRVRREIVEIY
ncbi:MAG: carboxypeptidase-like regulatory domain-containing protein [Bacteroidales bacterium]|nr:carboxypeptidase-like regulatory domain-containing protein [Bacteroidales bacterium]MDY6405564.1 carboxypeptidase-like regulatory domain-containing protein [Bacteroidales bacterium]